MSITRKLRKFRGLLSEGKYWEIAEKVLYNMGVDGAKVSRSAIYFMLSRKYRPLISAHVSAKLPTLGGGVMRISSGGCGYKARITLPKSARHVCAH